MRLDIIVLVIGLVFLLAAVVLTVMVRRAIRPRIVARREFNRHELTNRLKQMLPDAHRPPADTTPAMVSTLNGQGVSAKDVNLSLIDLATRGYLCISPLNERKDSWRDWVFTKVATRMISFWPTNAHSSRRPLRAKTPSRTRGCCCLPINRSSWLTNN